MPDHYLAINSDGVDETITGIETIEPTFGLPRYGSQKNSVKKRSF
jgi:flagellar biosynthesis component FlhA